MVSITNFEQVTVSYVTGIEIEVTIVFYLLSEISKMAFSFTEKATSFSF